MFRLLQYFYIPSLKEFYVYYDIAKLNNAFLSNTLTLDKILKKHIQLNAVPSKQATLHMETEHGSLQGLPVICWKVACIWFTIKRPLILIPCDMIIRLPSYRWILFLHFLCEMIDQKAIDLFMLLYFIGLYAVFFFYNVFLIHCSTFLQDFHLFVLRL